MSAGLKSILRKPSIDKTPWQQHPVFRKHERTKSVSFTQDTKEGAVDSDEEDSSVHNSEAGFSRKRTKSQAELDDYRRYGTSIRNSGKEKAHASKALRYTHDEEKTEIVQKPKTPGIPLPVRDLAIPAVPGQDNEEPKIWMLCHPAWFRMFPIWHVERDCLEDQDQGGVQVYNPDGFLRDLKKFSFDVGSFPASDSERFLKLFLEGNSGKARFWAFVVVGKEQEIFLWVTNSWVNALLQVHSHTVEELVDLAAESTDYLLPPSPLFRNSRRVIVTKLANVDASGKLRNEVGVHRPNWLAPTLAGLEDEFDNAIASESGAIMGDSRDDWRRKLEAVASLIYS